MPNHLASARAKDRYLTVEQKWRALCRRDGAAEGRFCYGVRSTGIFCRPACPSRLPKRGNVEFFESAVTAQAAGYRPCKRCRPDATPPAQRVVLAICRYLDDHLTERVTLARLSQHVGLSPYHLQRVFKAALGITPLQYQTAKRLARFKATLKTGDKVTTAVYAAGFGSSSRLYEKTPAGLGMTPGAYRRGGQGIHIDFTVFATDLGQVLLAATTTGLCKLAMGDNAATLERELREEYPAAVIQASAKRLQAYRRAVMNYLRGERAPLDLPLDLYGTVFQQRVWQVLRSIPYGQTRSYSAIATELGNPKATRAVAGACARNPVALVVPCHRVVGKDGNLSGYRWGKQRKQALLEREAGSATARRSSGKRRRRSRTG